MRLNVEYRHSMYNKADTCEAVQTDLDKVLDAYECMLWLFAEGICRCQAGRLEYLMRAELPFYLLPEVMTDLEMLVNHVISEQQSDTRAAA